MDLFIFALIVFTFARNLLCLLVAVSGLLDSACSLSSHGFRAKQFHCTHKEISAPGLFQLLLFDVNEKCSGPLSAKLSFFDFVAITHTHILQQGVVDFANFTSFNNTFFYSTFCEL